jgi:cytoskeleton protein RodZ
MPEDATRDFGAFLKDARERAGIPLRTIATNTKISMPSLEALERNDVARLPGGIFLRAFVRAYAKEVGLDGEETVRRFVARFPDAAAVEELTVHEPVQDRNPLGDDRAASRVWRVVGWSLPLALVIVYFGFGGRLSWIRDQLRPAAPRAEQQAEQAPPSSETPVLSTPAVPPPVEPAAAAATAAIGAPPPAGDVQTAANAVQPGAGADALRAGSGAAPITHETITAPSTEGRFTMALSSRARCWVTVRSDGKVVFSGTMQPGDRQNLVLGGSVSLTVGNAGAIAVELDGKPARALGTDGEVKTVRLTAQTLKDLLETR